ncbi:MAG: hypothetical protein R2751_17475 [Bacteroidales bacterium]
MDAFTDSLCAFLGTDTTGLPRMQAFVYACREDLQLFIAAPFWQTIHGRSIGTVNHLSSSTRTSCGTKPGTASSKTGSASSPTPSSQKGFGSAPTITSPRRRWKTTWACAGTTWPCSPPT